MREGTRKRDALKGLCAAALCLTLASGSSAAAGPWGQQSQASQNGAPAPSSAAVATFEERVNEYVKLREGVEEKMPKLSKDATAAQIETHKTTFQSAVRQARAGAMQGELFVPEVAAHIRAVIREEFKGQERAALRQTVFEAETKGVPLRINYPYPENKELVEMPPTLLLKLPTLPKQVRYRFVGQNMLLVDRENGLIIDYMTNAVP